VIVLCTSVISELAARRPSPAVVAWLDAQNPQDVATTVITIFDVALRIELVAQGARRCALEDAMLQIVARILRGRILSFDEGAAQEAAVLTARRRRAGRPLALADAQIAGIVRSNGATLVTRDTEDFSGLDLSVIDPWRA
jgi:toxin FitB